MVLNVDVEGFTTLSQELMKHSHAGVEVLSDSISGIYSSAEEAIEVRCGFLSAIAGDSFTAIFPEQNIIKLVSAAFEIRDSVMKQSPVISAFGKFELIVRLGIGLEEVNWKIVQSNEHLCYWFSGEAISTAVKAQGMAKSNQIVASKTVCEEAAFLNICELNADYMVISEFLEPCKDKKSTAHPAEAKAARADKYQPGTGEFREVLSCFINLAEPESKDVLLLMEQADKYGGYLSCIDATDKGWVALVIFGAPTAYEDQARRVRDFALEIIAHVCQNGRIGLTQGISFAGEVGFKPQAIYTAMGQAVNLAARLMLKAKWGEIWLDGQLRSALGDNCSTEAVGRLELKGLHQPVAAYRLLNTHAVAVKPVYQNAFIGRQQELKALHESCSGLWEGKFAGASYIYGEAGQGKTRLAYELEHILGDKVQSYWLPADSLQRSSMAPFVHWIKQSFCDGQAAESESRSYTFRKKWAEFTQIVSSLPDTEAIQKELLRSESILAGLIGVEWEGSLYASLEPKYRPSVTGFALRTYLEALCILKPTILFIEDLHLLDQESEDVFSILSLRAQQIRAKFVFTSRPLDNGKLPKVSLDKDVSVSSINLEGLSLEQVASCMQILLEAEASGSLIDYVNGASQGNPFVVEQLTKYLLETGRLSLTQDGFILSQTCESLPVGVQALLIARLDRLELELKRTVQTASVLGNEFTVNVLSHMLQILENRPESLNELIVQSELHAGEQEQIWNALSQIKYIFSHSLLREAAYDMQLKKQIVQLHLLAAQAMQQEYDNDKTRYAEIAMHFDRGDETDKAIEYYLLAGEHSLNQYNHETARNLYERALELCRKHYPEDHPFTIECCFKLGVYYRFIGDNQSSIDFTLQALENSVVTYGENHEKTIEAYRNAGICKWAMGDFDEAFGYQEKALSLCRLVFGEEHPGTALSLLCVGNILACKGKHDQAIDHFYQALDIQKSLLGENHPQVASTMINLANLIIRAKDYDQAMIFLSKAEDILLHQEPLVLQSLAACYSNMARIHHERGDHDNALQYIQRVLDLRERSLGENHPFTLNAWNHLAECQWEKGERELALQYYQTAAQKLKQISPFEYPYLSVSLCGIGRYYFEKEDFKTALEYYHSALLPEKSPLGLKSFYDPDALIKISEIHQKLGEYDEALLFCEKGLELTSAAVGKVNVANASILLRLGSIYLDMEKPQKAMQSLNLALKLTGEADGEEHELCKEAEDMLKIAKASLAGCNL